MAGQGGGQSDHIGYPRGCPAGARAFERGGYRDVNVAIVAPSFGLVSETFIAYHVRQLAPGSTVLICNDERGAELHGYPVLSGIRSRWEKEGGGPGRPASILQRACRKVHYGLSAGDRDRVAAFLRSTGVTHVLGEYGYSAALMTDACRALDIPLFAYFRGHDASSVMRSFAVRRAYLRMFQQARAIFCVSQYLADRIMKAGCPARLIHVAPSGVSLADFPPGSPEPGRILSVGRLVEKKRPDLVIRAFAGVADRFQDARLDLVGGGPLEARCRSLVQELGLEGRAVLHGALSHGEVAALARKAAVFVLHSVTAPNGDIEGFPTSIAEAMATGIPVVATRHSGIPEHVQEGKTGFLVEEGDWAGMSEALAALLANPRMASEMGQAARQHAVENLDRTRLIREVRRVMGIETCRWQANG